MAEMQNPNTDGDSTVLCGANSYVEKYYLNEQFSGLPESIKQELHQKRRFHAVAAAQLFLKSGKRSPPQFAVRRFEDRKSVV